MAEKQEDVYSFDAGISVMATSVEEAADKILEHFLDSDIAIHLADEGSLNLKIKANHE